MASIIMNAIGKGFTATQIIQFLLRKYPEHANKINAALASGYTAQQVLQYLTERKINAKSNEGYMTENEKYKKAVEDNKKKALRNTAATAALIGGAAALGIRGALAGSSAINPSEILLAEQALVQQQIPYKGPLAQIPYKAPQIPFKGPLAQLPNEGMLKQGMPKEPIAPITPNAPQTPIAVSTARKSFEMLSNLNQLDRVQTMLKAGNSPENIALLLNHIMDKDSRNNLQKAIKSGEVPSLTSMIEDVQKEMQPKIVGEQQNISPVTPIQQPMQTPQQPINVPPTPPPTPEPIIEPNQQIKPPLPQFEPESINTQEIEVPKQLSEPTQESSVKKGKLALTPNGVETVISDSGKKVLTEKDGKKNQYDKENIVAPSEGIATLYEKLKNAIPEHLISSVINWAGYDAENNELSVRFHRGDAYVYKNIPPDFVEKLKNAKFLAKTSGKNWYAMWTEGESSYGAGVSQLIKDLRKSYGDNQKEYIRKYETVHDFLAVPEAAVQEKLRRQNEEKRKAKGKFNEKT